MSDGKQLGDTLLISSDQNARSPKSDAIMMGRSRSWNPRSIRIILHMLYGTWAASNASDTSGCLKKGSWWAVRRRLWVFDFVSTNIQDCKGVILSFYLTNFLFWSDKDLPILEDEYFVVYSEIYLITSEWITRYLFMSCRFIAIVSDITF